MSTKDASDPTGPGLFCLECKREMDQPHPNFGRFCSAQCMRRAQPKAQAGAPNPHYTGSLRIQEWEPKE